MTNGEIYYFSGTGNSLKVASLLSDHLDMKLRSIISLLKNDVIVSDADVIGLVFPIYDFKAPDIVNDFIKKLETPLDSYFFAVCTYGVMPLKTMKKLEQTLTSSEKNLSAGFTIKMPHNGLGFSEIPSEKQEKMFEACEKKALFISDYVRSRKNGLIETSNAVEYIVLLGIMVRLLPHILPMFKQALFKGWDSLGFYADEQCTGCKVCEQVCPMENITMVGDRPCWSDKCIGCFACIHWCPQCSIQIANLTQKMSRYHHPDVNHGDIIKQKE